MAINMNLYKQASYLIIIIIFLSCTNNRRLEQNEIFGKYINSFEKKAEHYVVLNSDSTYLHYYKSDTAEFVSTGKWSSYRNTNGGVRIAFLKWSTYGYKNSSSCAKCYWAVDIKNGELYFSYDSPNEMNFRKDNK